MMLIGNARRNLRPLCGPKGQCGFGHRYNALIALPVAAPA